jgi:hypothetical protein
MRLIALVRPASVVIATNYAQFLTEPAQRTKWAGRESGFIEHLAADRKSNPRAILFATRQCRCQVFYFVAGDLWRLGRFMRINHRLD